MGNIVRIGTRGSVLARWQTDYIADLLRQAHPNLAVEIEVFTTRGDKILDTPLPLIGGKGLFTAELEAALYEGHIDFAVHSLKDLPTTNPAGLTIGAIPERARVADVLVSRDGYTLDDLPRGAKIGTSSRRRAAQLNYQRAGLTMLDIRGNIGTRIAKAFDRNGDYTAIVLAQAGLMRLGQSDAISQILPLDRMLPAPGQGALAVQCRADTDSLAILAPLNHESTELAVKAERAFLAGLGGGCAVPIAAYAYLEDEQIHLVGRVIALDGSQQIEVRGSIDEGDNPQTDAMLLGELLSQQALEKGAQAILEDAVE